MITGYVLGESMRPGAVFAPHGLRIRKVERTDVSGIATAGQPALWTLVEWEAEDDGAAGPIAEALADALEPENGWYADFTRGRAGGRLCREGVPLSARRCGGPRRSGRVRAVGGDPGASARLGGVTPAAPFLGEQFVRADPVRVVVGDGRDEQLVGARGLLELFQLVGDPAR